ncbi:hypothetical protein RSAG8_12863, partial [Rhizoctonia solani AG-8 WAC10335]
MSSPPRSPNKRARPLSPSEVLCSSPPRSVPLGTSVWLSRVDSIIETMNSIWNGFADVPLDADLSTEEKIYAYSTICLAYVELISCIDLSIQDVTRESGCIISSDNFPTKNQETQTSAPKDHRTYAHVTTASHEPARTTAPQAPRRIQPQSRKKTPAPTKSSNPTRLIARLQDQPNLAIRQSPISRLY